MNREKVEKGLLNFLGLFLIGILINIIGEPLGIKIIEAIKLLYDLIAFQGLLNELWITSYRFLLGFSIALATALPIGILLGRINTLSQIFDIPIEMLRPIPSAVIIPFGLIFLGIDDNMKIFVIWFGAFWPLLIYTREASKNIEQTLLNVAKSFHLSKFHTLKSLILPASIPNIVAGAKVSVSIALLLAVTVEMIAPGDPNGLGFFIIDSERSFDQPNMLAAVILLALFGYLINLSFILIEKFLYKKRYKYLRQQD